MACGTCRSKNPTICGLIVAGLVAIAATALAQLARAKGLLGPGCCGSHIHGHKHGPCGGDCGCGAKPAPDTEPETAPVPTPEPAEPEPAPVPEAAPEPEPTEEELTEGYSNPFRYGEGSFIGVDPPAGFDIKANERSMKYHIPGAIGYVRCNTDVWFNSAEAAERAGFTRSQR